MWVVGLGNPGRRYADTRHNVGQAVVLRLVERWQAESIARRPTFHAYRARVARPGRGAGVEGGADAGRTGAPTPEPGAEIEVTLVAPLAYMNKSGAALADFEAFAGAPLAPQRTLVLCDDVYLPVGYLRVRAQGSTGGHRGLASVEAHLGTPDYPRLRIGVGAAAGEPLVDHVLSRFADAEREPVAEALARACEAVEIWVREDLLAAMNLVNRRVREVNP